MATAPERSTAALSTRATFRPCCWAQWAASTAAPQAAMPPPRMSRSVSTTTVSKLATGASLQRENFRQAQRFRFGEQRGAVQIAVGLEAATGYRRAFRRGADGKLEAFQLPVPELHRPQDGIGGAER